MNDERSYDLAVVGAGPGGYVAAIRAAQLGMTTALVERRELGGTCLNIGCIPSKALLASSEHFHFIREHAGAHGIGVDNVTLDLRRMMQRKSEVVGRLVHGLNGLMRKNRIDVVRGTGFLTEAGCVHVEVGDAANREIRARHILIASGSVPAELPGLPFDGSSVVDSSGALAFEEVPRRLVVVGAGAIGLELGSVWARLGSKVSVLEFLPRIAQGFDAEVAGGLRKSLEGIGMEFHLETRVTGMDRRDGVQVVAAESASGDRMEFDADKILVAVGRKPHTKGLFRYGFGVETDDKGRIQVDDGFSTSVDGVFAIGDAVAGPMLAHKAEEEGVAFAEKLAGMPGHVNYDCIPNVVYTSPEAASVGLDPEAAERRGIDCRTGKYPFMANGRAQANGDTTGFVKVVADAKSDRLLGVHILSPAASELIAEAVAVMEFHGSSEDLARTVHAHPTLSEAMKEAALGVDGRTISL